MSRKDFELIARAIRYTRELAQADQHTIDLVVYKLADLLMTTNRLFDWTRFINACDVPKTSDEFYARSAS